MARPLKEVDVELLKKLAGIHCTIKEMASILGCSVDTLERRFADIIEKGRDEGKMSLRRVMFKKAVQGENTAMLIWLSKQHLGMSDKIEQKDTTNMTDEELYAEAQELLAKAKNGKD